MSETVQGSLVLTVAESKRLIARAVAAHPLVRQALTHGRLIVGLGTTNAYVIEELLGTTLDKAAYTAGVVTEGLYCVTPAESRPKPVVLVEGQPTDRPWTEVLQEFAAGDVLIKGANALDPHGNVGVLLAGRQGGTVGAALGLVTARGAHLLCPVGLEKLIPDVVAAARVSGIERFQHSFGAACGLMPIPHATVVTEIEALRQLAAVETTVLSAGGFGGTEGAVGLAIRGSGEAVERAMTLVRAIKGEPPLPAHRARCRPECPHRCQWGKKRSR